MCLYVYGTYVVCVLLGSAVTGILYMDYSSDGVFILTFIHTTTPVSSVIVHITYQVYIWIMEDK